MKTILKNYTFDAVAKTITLSDYTTGGAFRLDRLALITDVTTNQILYNFADQSVATASLSGTGNSVITLSAVPAGFTVSNNSDKLRIDYDVDVTDNAFGNTTEITKLTDGTNIPNMLKGSDGSAAGQNAQLMAGGYLSVAFTTTTVQAVGTTDAGNYKWVSVHTTSQGTGSTITFQGTNDLAAAWTSVSLVNNATTASGAANVSITASGRIDHGPLSFRYFRLNVTGISAGTTAGTIFFSALPVSSVNPVTMTAPSQAQGGAVATSTNAILVGGVARSALPAKVTGPVIAAPMTDVYGRLVVVPSTVRDLVTQPTLLTITSDTTVKTLIAAPGASIVNDITAILVTNTSNTACKVDILDNAVIVWTFFVPAQDTRGLNLTIPWKQSGANQAWTAQCGSSVADIRIALQYVVNSTA